ncbi:hypothetical protein CsSME_00013719 [Camellia sinensis var. sinensis]
MFYSSMDYAKETGETAAGTALIPTRFVWPYRGGSVFLYCSFIGWSGHYLMTPVEGCPTVFQTICSLPPSYHQYKIVVDDQWRHDEHQPFENGNYGTVNTVFLARESNYVPGILNPQMHCGSNMDVDNEAFQRLVRVSGGPLHEALPRGIPMAPLGDFCKGQFVGVLSALDFIMIVRELGSHGSNPMEEELETHTISAWKDAKSYLSRQIDGNGRLFPRQLVHAGPDENLKDVPLKILQNNVATVSVIHSSSSNASILQLLHLASLSGILKCTLNVLLGHYRCSNYQSVQFLWVPGFRELGKQIDGHWQC